MRRLRRWLARLVLVVVALAALGGGAWALFAADIRAAYSSWRNPPTPPPEPIRIGLVWGGAMQGLLVEGADLARQEINDRGGIQGRPLSFTIVEGAEDTEDPATGADIARDLTRADNMVAVIGHSAAKAAVMASITYENRGVLYINPAVTDRAINKHGFDHVFSTIPNNEVIGRQIATFAEGMGLTRIGVLSSREDWAYQTTDSFIQQAVTLGITIPVRRSFFGTKDTFWDLIAEFGSSQFDAVLIVARPQTVAVIIRQSMEMDLSTPFLVGALSDVEALSEAVGDNTPPVIMPILFNPGSDRAEIQAFRQRFRAAFDSEPDSWAAQGYDAVMMLTETMSQTGSTVPLSLATILRYTLAWRGVTGRHSFDRFGQIYTKTLDFATLERGRIVYAASAD